MSKKVPGLESIDVSLCRALAAGASGAGSSEWACSLYAWETNDVGRMGEPRALNSLDVVEGNVFSEAQEARFERHSEGAASEDDGKWN
jgi:hypothetical protein